MRQKREMGIWMLNQSYDSHWWNSEEAVLGLNQVLSIQKEVLMLDWMKNVQVNSLNFNTHTHQHTHRGANEQKVAPNWESNKRACSE